MGSRTKGRAIRRGRRTHGHGKTSTRGLDARTTGHTRRSIHHGVRAQALTHTNRREYTMTQREYFKKYGFNYYWRLAIGAIGEGRRLGHFEKVMFGTDVLNDMHDNADLWTQGQNTMIERELRG